MQSVEDIIEAAGGNAAVAALTGVGWPAISNWKARGRIPAEYFFIFEKVLPAPAPLELFGFKTENSTTEPISGAPETCRPDGDSVTLDREDQEKNHDL